MQNAGEPAGTRRWNKRFDLSLKKWSSWSTLILLVSGAAALLVFILAPYLHPGTESNSPASLLWWFHLLATVALLSTVLWSLFALCGVYIGPYAFWKHSTEFGPKIFLAATFVYFGGILIYFLAIREVWSDGVQNHLACRGPIEALYYGVHNHIALLAVTEGLFWIFDIIIISRINTLEVGWKSKNIDPSKYMWATDLRHQLRAWIYYVDRPATIAFIVLLAGVVYLEWTDVFLNHIETELFTSGAVFFSLMTANLAFYAANRQNPEAGGLQTLSDPMQSGDTTNGMPVEQPGAFEGSSAISK